ncbi:MAG: hypothetical protein KDC85_08970 [Saprospiraceae bacterium]|nr:hypothetical protein [Saprospiraceae bacterium]MCB9324793.1 hypothetical protein [Lewinellaceae bacterium]
MMYKSIAALMLLFMFACSTDPKVSNTSTADQPVAEQKMQPNDPAVSTPSAKPEHEDGPGLNLWVGSGSVANGAEVCIDVTSSKITGLLSMQYSMRWDPKLLEFTSVKGFTIPTMDLNDFGSHKAAEGFLTAVWIDDTLNGVNLENGDLLFQLCFKAIGASGEEAPVRFWSNPTPYEVVVLPEQVIPLTAHKGIIKIL